MLARFLLVVGFNHFFRESGLDQKITSDQLDLVEVVEAALRDDVDGLANNDKSSSKKLGGLPFDHSRCSSCTAGSLSVSSFW